MGIQQRGVERSAAFPVDPWLCTQRFGPTTHWSVVGAGAGARAIAAIARADADRAPEPVGA